MAESLYRQVLDRTVVVLKGEDLRGVRDDEIAVRELPSDGQITHAGITVSPAQEVTDVHTTERDRIGYPCIITVNRGSGKDQEDIDPRTENRRIIRKAFNHKRAPAETLCGTDARLMPCTAEYGSQQLPERYQENWSENRMVVWFWFLETRV